jgi:hypothetical protein
MKQRRAREWQRLQCLAKFAERLSGRDDALTVQSYPPPSIVRRLCAEPAVLLAPVAITPLYSLDDRRRKKRSHPRDKRISQDVGRCGIEHSSSGSQLLAFEKRLQCQRERLNVRFGGRGVVPRMADRRPLREHGRRTIHLALQKFWDVRLRDAGILPDDKTDKTDVGHQQPIGSKECQ